MDIKIPSGMIIGMIGENGSRKNNIYKSILKIVKPNQGNIKIFGKDINQEEEK